MRFALEAAVVDLLGDEPEDVGVQAPGAVEEQAEALGHGGVVAQHVVEARHLRSLGVGALGGLGPLAGVALRDESSARRVADATGRVPRRETHRVPLGRT